MDTGAGVLIPVTADSRPARQWGVLTVLTLYLALLVCVPAQLIVGPLGAAGTPATILGLGCFAWWALGRIDRRMGLAYGIQPVRIVLALYAGAMMASYVAGVTRAADYAEIRSADRALLSLVSGIGVALLAADGIRDRADLEALTRRMSLAAGLFASLGLIQFFFGIEVATYVKIPGLVANNAAQLIQERSSFRRVSGTASHPIEFGVALSVLLPITIHYALNVARHRVFYWCVVAVVAAAIPMSISRSAFLGTAAVWLVLMVGWDTRRRVNALIITPIALGLMRIAIPGLLGTIKSLFTNIANDPSYLGRTKDYEFVAGFIAKSPYLGRGPGTFIPDLYTTLDNQYLGHIVETGYIGFGALLLVLLTGIVGAWGVKRATPDPWQRSLGVALCASAMVPFVTFITFDALAFSIVTGLLFLTLGCVGAARRVCPRRVRTGGSTLKPVG